MRTLASLAPTCLCDCPSGHGCPRQSHLLEISPSPLHPATGRRKSRDHFLLHLIGHTREEGGNPYVAEGRGSFVNFCRQVAMEELRGSFQQCGPGLGASGLCRQVGLQFNPGSGLFSPGSEVLATTLHLFSSVTLSARG